MPDVKIVVVVEDELSAAVCRRVIKESAQNLAVDRVVVARGNGNIRSKIKVYEQASHFVRHLVLTDLDRSPCAPELIKDWNISAKSKMLFRVAVREVEAWVMADRTGFSDYFGVPFGKIPNDIESNVDPKATLISLVKKSAKKLAKGMAPESGNYSNVGPMYNQRLSEFVDRAWNVSEARRCAQSLERMILRLVEVS